jgi:hypothetical protein
MYDWTISTILCIDEIDGKNSNILESNCSTSAINATRCESSPQKCNQQKDIPKQVTRLNIGIDVNYQRMPQRTICIGYWS